MAAILFYLARRFPEAGLLPHDDIEAEAQAVSWMSFIASTVHPARRAGDRPCARACSASPTGDWGSGSGRSARYSIADIHLFRLFWRFRNAFSRRPGSFPNLSAHYDRMMARPAVQRTCEIEAAIGYDLPA